MQKDLKTAIIGIGGVGGYIGAKLTQHKQDVTLFARDKNLDAIKQNGLKIIDNKDEFIVHPKMNEEALFDVVFITSKSYDFKSVCKSIKDYVKDDTLIIPLANGVNHKDELKNYLDKGIICDGCIYIISNLKEYGVIEKKADTFYLQFGTETKGTEDRLKKLQDILNQSGLKSKYSKTIKYDCWKKYLFISSFASLTSHFKKPMGYVVEEQRELLEAVLLEIQSVANSLNIPISDEDIQKTIKQAQSIPYDSKTSMQIDFENEHKTELESLCGYIVKEANRLGVDAKNMEKIYTKLSGV
ncbi:MAG: ketopantoate reductase family protein [Thiovulaceae bacterium]|nr:ketopantoate reductase family protein [Sulfurimonadaceae bacterium]